MTSEHDRAQVEKMVAEKPKPQTEQAEQAEQAERTERAEGEGVVIENTNEIDIDLQSTLSKERNQKTRFLLCKIISGGQAGADLAGLRAARCLGLKTGGTAAPNYSTTLGCQPELLKSLGLSTIPLQSTWAAAYSKRSMMNVNDADATVVFRVKSSPGTDKTIGYCVSRQWKVIPFIPLSSVWERNGFRPVLVITEFTAEAQSLFVKFLVDRRVRILNVAGHRPWKENPSWEASIEKFLINALAAYFKK